MGSRGSRLGREVGKVGVPKGERCKFKRTIGLKKNATGEEGYLYQVQDLVPNSRKESIRGIRVEGETEGLV